jgi:hypothetical protein
MISATLISKNSSAGAVRAIRFQSGVSLGIKVDEEDVPTAGVQRTGGVDCDGRLSHTPF